MNKKQLQGNKKKARKKAWLDREAKRRAEKRFQVKTMELGNIEDMAIVRGIILK